MHTASDSDLSASAPIDHLLRRVLLMLFALGEAGLLTVWAMEWHDGTLSRTNAVGYPLLALTCLACPLALWRWPATLRPVRWIGFVAVAAVLMSELLLEVSHPGPLLGNYNAITMLGWLPLCYAIAFFMLEGRQTTWAAGLMLAATGGAAIWRGFAPVASAGADRALLLNTLIAHAVLVVCLSTLVWLKRVVAQQGEQATRLRLLAATDPLTGLANRRQGLMLLEAEVRIPRSDPPAALMIGDLDHFKAINDDFGHEMGDRVLVEIAAALRAHTRSSDTVVRWGGEEFLVLMPRTGRSEALELAERLRHCVQALDLTDRGGRAVPVTISLGLAPLQAGEASPAWLRRADAALYAAKAGGRNRCICAPGSDGSDASPTERRLRPVA
jgi:diguanylate cyclase (GGDEF)-like protein